MTSLHSPQRMTRWKLLLPALLAVASLAEARPPAGGAPVVLCAPDRVRCGTACVSFGEDAHHCGDCGHSCPADQSCVHGRCRSEAAAQSGHGPEATSLCAPGLFPCASGCASLAADHGNCGGCGRHCATDQQCQEGQCVAR
jgi:hypothetical protein